MFRLQTPWTPIPASPLSILHKHTMSRTKCLWPEQAQARFSHTQFNLTAEVLKHKILQNHHVRGNSKHVLGYFYRRDRVTLLCAAQPPRFSHQGFLSSPPQNTGATCGTLLFCLAWSDMKGCTAFFSKQHPFSCYFFQTPITAAHRDTHDIDTCHGAWKLKLSYNN